MQEQDQTEKTRKQDKKGKIKFGTILCEMRKSYNLKFIGLGY